LSALGCDETSLFSTESAENQEFFTGTVTVTGTGTAEGVCMFKPSTLIDKFLLNPVLNTVFLTLRTFQPEKLQPQPTNPRQFIRLTIICAVWSEARLTKPNKT
jgi:hypothetical protein